MRNDNNDHRTLDKSANENIKNHAKYPTYTIGKFLENCPRLKDLKAQKCDENTKSPNMKLKVNNIFGNNTCISKNVKTPEYSTIQNIIKFNKKTLTPCKDVKQINQSVTPLSISNITKLNSDQEFPKLNEDNVLKFNKKFLEKATNKSDNVKCVSEDSRLTGGGLHSKIIKKDSLTSYLQSHSKANESLPLSKKNSNETTNKVSFKTKNTRKVTTHCVKTNNTIKVAALTHKFDEIFKENSHPKIASKNESENKQDLKCDSNLVNKSSDKIIKTNRTVCKSNSIQKRITNGNTVDKSNVSDSPVTHRKIYRIKSDASLRKRSFTKKKIHDESIDNATEDLDTKAETIDTTKTKFIVRRKPSFKNNQTRHSNSVQATIQKFETGKFHNDVSNKISSTSDTNISTPQKSVVEIKPKLPEKKTNLSKTKNVVLKDGKPKIKLIVKNESDSIVNKPTISNDLDLKNKYSKTIINCDKTFKVIPTVSDDLKTIDDINITPRAITKSPKLNKTHGKKEFHYDKFSIHNRLHGDKLKIISSEPNSISPTIPIIQIQDTLEENSFNDSSNIVNTTLESSDSFDSSEIDGKISEIVNTKIKPNESFLWRANSKPESSVESENSDLISQIDFSDIFDILTREKTIEPVHNQSDSSMASIEELYPSYKTLLQKTDELLEIKKREIANQLKIDKTSQIVELEAEAINLNLKSAPCVVEAINMLAINDIKNIRNEISLMCLDDEDEYEPLEPYQAENDLEETSNVQKISSNYLHTKANCPLPEVPNNSQESDRNVETDDNNHENIYQCLRDPQSHRDDDNCSLHSYEYCHTKLSENNNSKNDSDDGYEYCKAPKPSENSPSPKPKTGDYSRFSLSKSDSVTSSVGYEKISSIYEKIPPKSQNDTNNCLEEECYADYNCVENIYDTIKSDTTSVLNGYEKMTDTNHSNSNKQKKFNFKSSFQSILMNKHIPYDTISNISLSTISSDQKTNSIYGQRSIISLDKPISNVYSQAPSEISLSDRSDDWEDVSDQEKSHKDTKTILVRERSKGRHSPASWSRKVRNHWNAKKSSDSDLFVSSPSIVYITTSKYANHYSDNDNFSNVAHSYQKGDLVFSVGYEKLLKLKDLSGLAVLKVLMLHDNTFETQETTMLIDIDSSDGEHIYESVFPPSQKPNTNNQHVPLEDEFDSFDSDSETEQTYMRNQTVSSNNKNNNINYPKLPEPPISNNINTITRFAKKKMNQIFTKSTRKKSVSGIEKSPDVKPEQTVIVPKLEKKAELSNEVAIIKNDNYNIYQNIDRPNMKKDKSNTSDLPQEKYNKNNSPTTENIDNKNENDRKKSKAKSNTYLSFKSKFRRSISVVNSLPTSPLSPPVQNSTFYLDSTNDSSFESNNRLSYQMETTPTDKRLSVLPGNNDSLDESVKNGIFDDENHLNNSNARKSSPPILKSKVTSTRPIGPPPPPPDDIKRLKKGRINMNSAKSWYAECGLFNGEKLDSGVNPKERISSTSWYAEIGLYQPSNVSTSSGTSSTMSGSGTCSTTTAFSSPSTPTPPLGMFNQEPLYQFYNAAKLESVCRDLGSEFDSDNYEEITHYRETNIPKPVPRPSPIAFIIPHKGPSRTLWCEIPEVINSSILDTLSPKHRKFQEAKFEIITSEASYLNSLIVLESSYINHPAFQDEKILTKTDKQMLFGNFKPVKKCSERLMAELEACWQDNITLRGLCKIIKNHGDRYFHVYVTYCENQVHLNKTMKRLKMDIKFTEILNQMQSQPACQSLSLDSFLLLPMQRVTRIPLLLDAVLKHIDETNEEYSICVDALTSINNVVCRCNEGARNIDRIEEMSMLSNQIEFPPHIKEIPIMIASDQVKVPQRWLIRSGELTHLVWRGDDQSKLTFGKKFNKSQVYLFLFTDLLIVTKKKSGEELYTVVDYCKRSLIEMTSSNMMTQLPIKETAGRFIVLLTLLENHEEKTIEMLFSCTSETDRQRWMEAALPPTSNNPDERVYEGWDCPQVMAKYSYHTAQSDELMLQPGDIINVHRKMGDGWYQGERMRDGELGWFPGTYTFEVESSHARARNLRQRYRILELSGSYLRKDNKKITPLS